jgi:transposase
MSNRRSREGKTPAIAPLTVDRRNVAGLDLANNENWVCVDPSLTPQNVRRYEAFTRDLKAMVAWLLSLGVVSVAMEATGPYWMQVFREIMAAGMEAVLVDPRQTRSPRNRKTDMLDCQNIWQLHAHGLLSAAFVPGEAVQTLRTFLRFRKARETRLAETLTAMHEALARMNIKLGLVLSDLGGDTGLKIVSAILTGERDPLTLARLRDPHCKHSALALAKALEGSWRDDDLFLLQQAYQDHLAQLQAIAEADRKIEALLPRITPERPEKLAITDKRSTHKSGFSFDAQTAVTNLTGVDLAAIDGIAPHTALNFIGEIGFSVAAWHSSSAFCCWLGLCPNPKRSGGRNKGNMPTTATRAADILKRAAHGLTNKPSPAGRRFATMSKRKGRKFAIKDAAHRYARIIYAMLSNKSVYDPAKLIPKLSVRQKAAQLAHLEQRATALGMRLVPTT